MFIAKVFYANGTMDWRLYHTQGAAVGAIKSAVKQSYGNVEGADIYEVSLEDLTPIQTVGNPKNE